MGSNVFGTPITEEYVREMQDKIEIGQKEKAKVALMMKNEDGKDVRARVFAERLVPRFGEKSTSTMCLIYNATGDTITFFTDYNWIGRICESPYPTIIQNGQWGVFLHAQYYGGEEGSKAAVIYSGSNSLGDPSYWVTCFGSTPSGNFNQVYVGICKPTDYNLEANDNSTDWNAIERKFDATSGKLVQMTEQNGGLMFGAIGNIKSSFCEAILTLPAALT